MAILVTGGAGYIGSHTLRIPVYEIVELYRQFLKQAIKIDRRRNRLPCQRTDSCSEPLYVVVWSGINSKIPDFERPVMFYLSQNIGLILFFIH